MWMIRKIVAVWVSLAMLFGLVVIVDVVTDITPLVKAATTLYVGGIGPGNYTNIQWAIDNATNGDTVFVYNGTYYENVIVNKMVNLIGEDRENTIVNGSENGDVIKITVDWVNITCFNITYAGNTFGRSGIELDGVHNCRIVNNNVSTNNDIGINIISSWNITLTRNIISDNYDGIYFDDSYHNNISANDLSGNNNGIRIWYSNNNIVSYNQLTSHSPRSFWIYRSKENKIFNNLVSGDWTGMEFDHCNDTQIFNNTVKNNDRNGLYLRYCERSYIFNNTIKWNDEGGIFIYNSNDCIITHNIASRNYVTGLASGISVSGCRNMIKNHIGDTICFYGIRSRTLGFVLIAKPDPDIPYNHIVGILYFESIVL